MVGMVLDTENTKAELCLISSYCQSLDSHLLTKVKLGVLTLARNSLDNH